MDEFLSAYVKVKEYKSSPKAKRQRITKTKLPRYGFCRYADDFIITAESKKDLEILLPNIKQWLAKRGLQLNLENNMKYLNVCDE
ncbi:MAG: reverse transcriptase domain-containing protein [Cyanobacteria bacterium P01_A01_bin.83]